VLVQFAVEHAAMLVLLLVVAATAGAAVAGRDATLSLRAALGLAMVGQAFILLGAIGGLQPWTIGLIGAAAILGGSVRMERGWWTRIRWKLVAGIVVAMLPLLFLTLYPPIAFDETHYHLPFIQAIAGTGRIGFLADLRFPAFPQLHELLCVPPFLMLDDVATHLVALVEVLITAAVLTQWPRQREAGLLAAALFLGSPIIIQLGTVTHVDAALTLFVAAGFYCLDRLESGAGVWYAAAAGFLLGSGCCVKYLGWYFVVSSIAFLSLFGVRRRRIILLFLASLLLAVLPMYGRIVYLTGSPLFPFLPQLFGSTPWTMLLPLGGIGVAARIARGLRVFWDATFARERLNGQPPYSPLFALSVLITFAAAFRSRKAAFLCVTCAGYLAIFTFLPQDSRYLLPLLPLVSIAAATALGAWLGRVMPASSNGINSRPSRRVIPSVGRGIRGTGGAMSSSICAPPSPRIRRSTLGTWSRKLMIVLPLLAITPGATYVGYRLALQGRPPVTAAERRQYLEQRIPEYRALEVWTSETRGEEWSPLTKPSSETLPNNAAGRGLYVCGAEQLKYFGGAGLMGDVDGPFGAGKIFDGTLNADELSRRLTRVGARYLLLSRAHCPLPWQRLSGESAFERVYADGGATLWRIRERSATNSR
jgi:hypothetical protein